MFYQRYYEDHAISVNGFLTHSLIAWNVTFLNTMPGKYNFTVKKSQK